MLSPPGFASALLSKLPSDNHHFSGFEARLAPLLRIQVTDGVTCDNRSDRLTADFDADRGVHRFDPGHINPLHERLEADAHKLRGGMQSERFNKYLLVYCCFRIHTIEFERSYTV